MNEPLIVITSRVHVPRMKAHKILMDAGYQHWMMVVDNIEQARRAVDEAGIPGFRLVCAQTPDSIPRMDRIAYVRQFVEEQLIARGSWYVSLDDNVSGWTALPEPWSHQEKHDFELIDPVDAAIWRLRYARSCPFEDMIGHWNDLIAKCEAEQTWAGGFAIETNYFFRSRKWQYTGYVRAQNAVWKNTGLPFYYWPGAMQEDMIRSVDVVAQRGCIVINRYVKPIKQFFEPGGIGTFEERKPALVACSDEMLRRWPGLLRRNKGQDYQLTFGPKTKQQVNRWREASMKV